MATLHQLYELVHSLDKHEKKHLSLMVSGVGGKAKQRYAASLKVLNGKKEFDAEQLKTKLGQQVKGMNLSEANTNLYEFIGKAMLAYHAFSKPNLSMQKDLLLVEIFMSKGLYETANRVLQPLKKRLSVAGTFSMMHRSQELQNNININYRKLNINYEKRYAHYRERLGSIEEHRQFVEITMLNTQFFELAQKVGDPRTKSQLQQYVNFSKNPLLQHSFKEVTTRGIGTYITLKLALENMAQSNSGVYDLSKEAREELRKRYTDQDYFMQDYYVIDFVSAQAIAQRDEKLIRDSVRELENSHRLISNSGQRQKIQARILMSKLTICGMHGKIKLTEQVLAEWMAPEKKTQWIKANLAYINLFLAARLLYLGGKPEKALDYLLMLQSYEKTMRPALHISYRFLFLLCHYKLKNYTFLQHATESLYRYLLKLDKLYAPEKALLRFVKKCDHFDKVKSELKILADTFRQFEDDFYHRAFFVFGDYKEWLSMEKINNRG